MYEKQQQLKNQIFGVYKVLNYNIEYSKEKKKTYYTCECQNCGNITNVRLDSLKKFPQKCVKCKYPNLIGKQYGRLFVLEKGKTDKFGHIYWICECSCGNIVEVAGTNLTQGKTQSCGCLHKEITHNTHFQDLTGQQFGKLNVLYFNKEKSTTKYSIWHCKCSCGTEIDVQTRNLKNGHTISCGCIHSKGEFIIRQCLNNLQLKYKTEFTFLDLPNRRFDFAIFNNEQLKCLIEFDGKQHYSFINTWHQTEEEFIKSQQRDQEKNQYCKKHNIPLIRIPYWELDNINKEWLLNKIQETTQNDE